MDIEINDDYKKGTVTVINEMSQNNNSIARYYEKKRSYKFGDDKRR